MSSRLVFVNFQNGISRNTCKCELGEFSLRQSHIADMHVNMIVSMPAFTYKLQKNKHTYMVWAAISQYSCLIVNGKAL